jgi:hypothetical protein
MHVIQVWKVVQVSQNGQHKYSVSVISEKAPSVVNHLGPTVLPTALLTVTPTPDCTALV